jgi:hypothetical protein
MLASKQNRKEPTERLHVRVTAGFRELSISFIKGRVHTTQHERINESAEIKLPRLGAAYMICDHKIHQEKREIRNI